jgi:hypothetical protein
VTELQPADRFALPPFVRSYAAERAAAFDGGPALRLPRSVDHASHARS